MNRLAALAVAAALPACHLASEGYPGTLDTMVGQWRSTDHGVTSDMTLARRAAGGEAVEGTPSLRDYYGPGTTQAFTVAGDLNGLTWTQTSNTPINAFPLGDGSHLSGNPTFTVRFRDQERMLLASDTEVALEFLRQ
jgi:hypothetical protein